MSQEIYNQQKEILELKSNIKKLKFEIQNSQYNNLESLESSNETPPHY
ncbi:SlyX family protein [Alphaproteobacteria bacterium]|nr:SlyX family protein [Alphaproteobacteria bacterium]